MAITPFSDVRFVGAFVDVNNARKITDDLFSSTTDRTNKPIPSEQRGYYVQVAYDIFGLFKIDKQELYVFGIYEDFDAHAKVPQGSVKPAGHKLKVFNVGLSYKPHPLVAIKTDCAMLNYSPCMAWKLYFVLVLAKFFFSRLKF